MNYEDEARIAQQVLDQLASRRAILPPRSSSGARGAQVDLLGVGYSVHRHGNDLRFNQRTNIGYGEVGRYLIVAIGEHTGGWMVARAVRPPGEYHDERAAEAARRLVERTLAELGHPVGSMGREGRRKTAQELEADLQAFLSQPTADLPVAPARRARRRRSAD